MRVALVQVPLETVHRSDHIPEHGRWSCATPGKRKHTPAGQLAMPDKSMTSQLLTIFRSKVSNDISFGKGECVLRRLGRIPL